MLRYLHYDLQVANRRAMSDTGEENGLVFSLVNGILIKKETFKIEIYPELINTAKELIHLLEVTYEEGIRRGMQRIEDDDSDNSGEESP